MCSASLTVEGRNSTFTKILAHWNCFLYDSPKEFSDLGDGLGAPYMLLPLQW